MSEKFVEHQIRYTWRSIYKMHNEQAIKSGGTLAQAVVLLNLNPNKVMMNIEYFGNTTAATLPLLLNDYENKLNIGDKLVFAAFGGGFTWGAAYLTWAY